MPTSTATQLPWERTDANVTPVPVRGYLENVLQVLNVSVPNDGAVRYGVELELNPAPGEYRTDLARALGRVFNQFGVFIAKTDGSVPRGLEIVTLPMDLATQNAFISAMLPLPARAASNCGVHIHISRAPLGYVQMWRMFQFIHNGSSSMHRFIDAVARRRQNTYCRRWRHTSLPRSSGHYDAIGISSRHATLELRIFAATNKPEYLRSYVQFAAALVTFCHDTNASSFDYVNPNAFMAFVAADQTTFPDLYTRIFRNQTFAEFRNAANVTAAAPQVRRSRTTGDRERRTRSHVPTTGEVRAWLSDYFGVDTDVRQSAEHLMHGYGYRAAQRAFVTWYRNNCFDPTTNERDLIITSTGRRVVGSEIRSHALYHLRLV